LGVQPGLSTFPGNGLGLSAVEREVNVDFEFDNLLSTCRTTCSIDEPRSAEPPKLPPCQALSSRHGVSVRLLGKIDSITVSLTVADGVIVVQPVLNTTLMRITRVGNLFVMVTLRAVMKNHHTKSNKAVQWRKRLRFWQSFVRPTSIIFATMRRYGKNHYCFVQPLWN
jgi:hypothetical protein